MIPAVIAFYVGHKLVNRTRIVPLQECNFDP
jgi:amino acid permease